MKVFADRICLLLSPGYPNWDKREPLPYLAILGECTGGSETLMNRSYCSCCLAQFFELSGKKDVLLNIDEQCSLTVLYGDAASQH